MSIFKGKRVVIFHKDHPFSPTGIHSGAEMGTIHLARAMALLDVDVSVIGRITTGGGIYDGVNYIDMGAWYDIRKAFEKLSYPIDILICVSRADVLAESHNFPGISRRMLWMQDSTLSVMKGDAHTINSSADILVYVSNALRQVLERQGLDKDKGVVIYNGFDENIFYPRNVDVDPNRIMFAGALVPEKGIHLLIEAFNLLCLKYKEAHLWFYGSESLWGYKGLIDGGRICFNNPHIHFAGKVTQNQLAEAFSRSLLNVIPSLQSKRIDPFPLTSIEAQACGCPVVVSKCGGLPEGVIHGETGFIFNDENPPTLSKLLQEALGNSKKLIEMRKKALYHVKDNFRWKKVAGNFLAVADKFPKTSVKPVILKNKKQEIMSILALYEYLPRYDRSGGDFRAYSILKGLVSRGHRVCLIVRDDYSTGDETARYRAVYESMGIETHILFHSVPNIVSFDMREIENLETIVMDRNFDAIWISWWNIALAYLTRLKKIIPDATFIVDSVDVAFLRIMREASLYDDPTRWYEGIKMLFNEFNAYVLGDGVLAVTEDDARVLKHILPTTSVAVVPNLHPLRANPAPFEERKDILFVGTFKHRPNVDAALYLVKTIFPMVKKELPDVKLFIVGNEPPDEVKELSSDDVIVTGYVEDLSPYWQRARISVCPLRYGAGMKGKVGQSMAEGIPVVTTTVGIEGMDVENWKHAIVADTAEGLADGIVKIYSDEKIWKKISENAYRFAKEHWSPEIVTEKMLDALKGNFMEIPENNENKALNDAKLLKYCAKGFDWIKLGFPYSAYAVFLDILKDHPYFISAYVGLASVKFVQGDFEGALEWLRKAQLISSNSAGVNALMGLIFKDKGQLRRARAKLNRALAIYPDFAPAHKALGDMARQEGKISEAITHYKKALQTLPDDVSLHLTLAQILIDSNQIEAASIILKRARAGAEYQKDREAIDKILKMQTILNKLSLERGLLEPRAEINHKTVMGNKENERMGTGKNILVIDAFIPFFDRASGSLRTYKILEALRGAGHRVTFISRSGVLASQYIDKLQQMGIKTFAGDARALRNAGLPLHGEPELDVKAILAEGAFDTAILFFWHMAEYYLPLIRKYSPETSIIVDSVDVHFIREMRQAEIAHSTRLKSAALDTKRRELAVYSEADRIWVVTPADKKALRKFIKNIPIDIITNIHENVLVNKIFEKTEGLLFVGNFNHLPNVDAIIYFHKMIWPKIKNELPEVICTVAGVSPPEEIRHLSSKDFNITGYVKDLGPYLMKARISINPLRFGAGMKGKIGQALSWGLPVVTTTIGAEGMGLENGKTALIADTPDIFAQKVIKLYHNKSLWTKLSVEGKKLVNRKWSPNVVNSKVLKIISSVRPKNVVQPI